MLLSQLNYFQAVAQYEHISKAAEQLHIAQPSLSSTISKLEKELNVSLFDRKGRNIKLNETGAKLLEHSKFIFNQLNEMEKELYSAKENLENGFTLSVSNNMFLNGWLQDFVLENPKLRLQQKMLSEDQMITALFDESIDIALGEFDRDVPGIERKTIINDEYVVTMACNHPLAKKETIVFEDIKDENIIALPSNTIYRIADRLFAQKSCKPNIVFEGNARMMNKMVSQGHGILLASKQMLYMPYFNAKKRNNMHWLDEIKVTKTISDLDCHCNLSLCWKKERELPKMACKFIDAIERSYPDYKEDVDYIENICLLNVKSMGDLG